MKIAVVGLSIATLLSQNNETIALDIDLFRKINKKEINIIISVKKKYGNI